MLPVVSIKLHLPPRFTAAAPAEKFPTYVNCGVTTVLPTLSMKPYFPPHLHTGKPFGELSGMLKPEERWRRDRWCRRIPRAGRPGW